MNKKQHFIYAGIFLFIILLCVIIIWLKPAAAVAEIYLDGELVETIRWSSLTETVRIPVGGGNVVAADSSGVWMEEANCPDKLCIRQGKRRVSGMPIVCLPNRVTVVLKGGEKTLDGVAG